MIGLSLDWIMFGLDLELGLGFGWARFGLGLGWARLGLWLG